MVEGGTAGLAIASRLAESYSVAVIEVGGFYEVENSNQSIVPWYALTMGVLSTLPTYPRQPLVDWDLVSVPQTGAANRRIHFAQGKTLGGSSAINTMGYHRGTVGTYQRWADLAGDQSYTWPNVLPYFKKSTTLTPPDMLRTQLYSLIRLYLTTHSTDLSKSLGEEIGLTLSELGLLSPYNRLVCLLAIWVSAAAFSLLSVLGSLPKSSQRMLLALLRKLAT